MRWQQPLVLPRQVSEAATWGWRGTAGDRDGGRSGGTDPVCPRSSSSTDAASIPACPDASRHFPGETRRVWHRSMGRRECGVQGSTHHPTLSAGGVQGRWVPSGPRGPPVPGWVPGRGGSAGGQPRDGPIQLCAAHICVHNPPYTHPPRGSHTRTHPFTCTPPPAKASAARARSPARTLHTCHVPNCPHAGEAAPGDMRGLVFTSCRWGAGWGSPGLLPPSLPSWLPSLPRPQERSAGGLWGRGPLPPVSFPLSSYA